MASGSAGSTRQFTGQEDLGTYNPMQIGQFTAANGLIQQLLANPHSMSAQGVGQLKQRQMEDAMAMQQQLSGQMAQRYASRGTMGGGSFGADGRRLGADTMETILGGNRDIDIAKMQQDRADELGVIGAAQDVYKTGLAGQMAQSDENRFGFTSKQDAIKFALNRALEEQRLAQGSRGLDIDQQRVSNQNSQFGLSHQLSQKQFEDQMKQWRARLNFDFQNGARQSNDGTNPF
jgi:hypothetical protein